MVGGLRGLRGRERATAARARRARARASSSARCGPRGRHRRRPGARLRRRPPGALARRAGALQAHVAGVGQTTRPRAARSCSATLIVASHGAARRSSSALLGQRARWPPRSRASRDVSARITRRGRARRRRSGRRLLAPRRPRWPASIEERSLLRRAVAARDGAALAYRAHAARVRRRCQAALRGRLRRPRWRAELAAGWAATRRPVLASRAGRRVRPRRRAALASARRRGGRAGGDRRSSRASSPLIRRRCPSSTDPKIAMTRRDDPGVACSAPAHAARRAGWSPLAARVAGRVPSRADTPLRGYRPCRSTTSGRWS